MAEEPHPLKEPAVRLEDVTVAYGDRPALWDVDLEIPKGSLTAVVGPNGAGKTTLMKTMLGLLKPATGRIEILGKPAQGCRGKVAFVPQRGSVDWDYPATVGDLALMGTHGSLPWWKPLGENEKRRARQALELVDLANLADRPINQLSGGQQQRAFLARALSQEAPLLVLDEPFQGIDASTERAILDLFRKLREKGHTLIVVHHDLHTVRDLFDYCVLLNVRVVAAGPTESTMNEENLRATYGPRLGLDLKRPGNSPLDGMWK
ncbi:MAG: metal ABC transporter ATP-binding protein [Gemmataceae bacterium]